MKPHELFKSLPAETAQTIIRHFREEDARIYANALASLAAQRKLRPVFIQRKPRAEQVAWIAASLGLRGSDELAEQLLVLWLLKARKEMLCDFLDQVGIAHDGQGNVENLPEELDGGKTRAAAAKLLEKYPAEEVALYLNFFQMQKPEGWPALAEAIAAEPRLKLEAPSPAGRAL